MKAPLQEPNDATRSNGSTRRKPFLLEVSDVTGTSTRKTGRFQPSTPAGAVAQALAAEMDLPRDVTWALRNDYGGVLQEDVALGAQVESGEKLSLTPKVHLG